MMVLPRVPRRASAAVTRPIMSSTDRNVRYCRRRSQFTCHRPGALSVGILRMNDGLSDTFASLKFGRGQKRKGSTGRCLYLGSGGALACGAYGVRYRNRGVDCGVPSMKATALLPNRAVEYAVDGYWCSVPFSHNVGPKYP